MYLNDGDMNDGGFLVRTDYSDILTKTDITIINKNQYNYLGSTSWDAVYKLQFKITSSNEINVKMSSFAEYHSKFPKFHNIKAGDYSDTLNLILLY